MSEKRLNKISLVVGGRGTGKTTFVKQIIKANVQPKVLIVDTFEHPAYSDVQTITIDMLPRWKKGIKRIIIRDFLPTITAMNQHVYNTLIVFEDCTKYFRSTLPDQVFHIFYDSKQKNNDIILLYHGFRSILPEIMANANTLTLFKIGEQIKRYAGKMDFDQVDAIHKQIQASPDPFIHKTILING